MNTPHRLAVTLMATVTAFSATQAVSQSVFTNTDVAEEQNEGASRHAVQHEGLRRDVPYPRKFR